MTKSAKIWLFVATALVLLGLIILAGVMCFCNWDFSKFSTVEYETNTYKIGEEFENISICVDTTDITFAPGDDETCKIVCYETENLRHSAAVQNGVLVINTAETSEWYDHIGIFLNSPKMTVYLPEYKYAEVFIETDTGEILISDNFSFKNLEINGNSGDILCLASSEEMKIETDTGNIEISGIKTERLNLFADTGNITLDSVETEGTLELRTDSGKIDLTDVICPNLKAASDSGNIKLRNVAASGSFSLETNTGEVLLEDSDAGEIFVETDSGDVCGNLLSEKVFITRTDTGRIDVPKTTTGGICEITTDSGDIILAISK